MAFPLIRARFRVLVLKDTPPANPEFPVIAICIERNLVGRGRTEPEALWDLDRTLWETIKYQVENLAPAPLADSDPALLAAFDNPAQRTIDGDIILERLQMLIETDVSAPPRRKPRTIPPSRVIFESCVA